MSSIPTIKELDDIYNKTRPSDEFEIMFNNYKQTNLLGLAKYVTLLEFLTNRGKFDKSTSLSKSRTLDILYGVPKTKTTFRLTVDGVDNVNAIMKKIHKRKNHVIYKVVLEKFLSKDNNNIKLIKKTKDYDTIHDVDDYNFRVRLSKEEPVSKKEIDTLKNIDNTSSIMFRYKERVTLSLLETADHSLVVDLTSTKMSQDINNIESVAPRYELEIDYTVKRGTPSKDHLKKIYREINILLKIIQQSNFIVSTSTQRQVLLAYSNLLGLDSTKIRSLEGRKPVSLEKQYLVDKLPDRYSVTDKADGDRYFLMIVKDHVYLISDNLNVKDTGIKLKDENWDNTILDGEEIYIRKKNRHLFMSFDCLFKKGEDIRQEQSHPVRLQHIDEIVKNCFILGSQKGHAFKPYEDKFDTDKIEQYHKDEIKRFLSNLNNDIEIEKKNILVRRKYFASVNGGKQNEIFKYQIVVWNGFTKGNCPYTLDGTIFHPQNEKYITNIRESKYTEYKWKPENQNSLDIFIRFQRDRETNKVLTLFDNSKSEMIENRPYKICKLYVGEVGRDGRERPVLFKESDRKHLAYLYLDRGEVRDEDGKIIQDGTVVEFYLKNDPNINEKFRWVPMRTRYDKTQSVLEHRRKYGNNANIANRIYRSMTNPITMDDFGRLGNDSTFEKHMNHIKSTIDSSLIVETWRENQYYQLKTNLAKPMRSFHNWMKSIIIYTYCHATYQNNKLLSVLDIGCGRGGDIMKFYYPRGVKFYVGIDPDLQGLQMKGDGAISRYENLKKQHPNFPKFSFIHADATAELSLSKQEQVLGGMGQANRKLMEQYFPNDKNKRTKFDVISAQFSMHYMLKDDQSWNTFCENINNHLKPGGYMMITLFDGNRVMELLKDTDKHTTHYTDRKGEKRVMFEIVKRYKDPKSDEPVGTGYAIDIYNATFNQEGTYTTEYVVDQRFLVKEFKKRCNMSLADTDLFYSQFEKHREFFTNSIQYESVDKTKKFFGDVYRYYDEENEENKASYPFSMLNRYYIFRKD